MFAQLHPTKNSETNTSLVTISSGKKLWWLDGLGHEWEAIPAHRSRGTGCPYCSGKRVLFGFNDLFTLYPLIAAQWDYEENGTLSPQDVVAYSNKRVGWICSKGHRWHATVNNRTGNSSGCPDCLDYSSSKIETALFLLLFECNLGKTQQGERLAVKWSRSRGAVVDILISDNAREALVVEYHGEHHHASKQGNDLRKTRALIEAGYRVLRVREGKLGKLDYEHDKLRQVCYFPKGRNHMGTNLPELVSQIRDHWYSVALPPRSK